LIILNHRGAIFSKSIEEKDLIIIELRKDKTSLLEDKQNLERDKMMLIEDKNRLLVQVGNKRKQA
jgi:hypothetical protein